MVDLELVLVALRLLVLAGLLGRDLIPQLLLLLRTQGLVVVEAYLELVDLLLRLEAVAFGVDEFAAGVETLLQLLILTSVLA